jgi:hypothetical protein
MIEEERRMIFTTEENPRRDGWIYEEHGGGYVGYREDARPDIVWNHIDGPLLYFRNGELHWLTLWERLRHWMGLEDVYSLERKHRPHLPQGAEVLAPTDTGSVT